jgi:hypothetical protein
VYATFVPCRIDERVDLFQELFAGACTINDANEEIFFGLYPHRYLNAISTEQIAQRNLHRPPAGDDAQSVSLTMPFC